MRCPILQSLIVKHAGDLKRFCTASEQQGFYIRLKSPPYERLCIEHIGTTWNGCHLVSVAHYYEQNGDLMKDPDVEFLVDDRVEPWEFATVSFEQSSPPIYQRFIQIDDRRIVVSDRHGKKDCEEFVRLWERNLRDQGFLAVSNSRQEEDYHGNLREAEHQL
jgi:hypothetical protein